MPNDYELFSKNILRKTGIDLSLYKESQMKRRLTSLYEKRGFRSFDDYFIALDNNNDLLNECLDRMTINVSEFFRNKNRWDIVEKKVFPELLNGKKKIKIWSAACSTGEEPYTLAMILSKYIPIKNISIMATDIDVTVIEKAKKGIYNERSVAEMPKEWVGKFFTHKDGMYCISDEIKNCVEFKKHNLLRDSFPTDCDLIVCRNVLIYFTDEAKVGLYEKFQKSLRTGGILFVGSTEQIFIPQKYGFNPYDTFFYKKI